MSIQTKFFPSRFQNVDANGDVIVGSLEFYATGTTNKITTYSNYNRASANGNPINADSNGRFGPIFFNPANVTTGIKVIYYSAINGAGGSGSAIYTDDRYDYQDPLVAADITALLTATTIGEKLYARTSQESAASIDAYDAGNSMGDITKPQYPPGDARRYGLVGNGSTDDYPAINAAIQQNLQAGGAPIYTPPLTCHLNTGLAWCNGNYDNKTWHSDQTILNVNSDITALTIGPVGSADVADHLNMIGEVAVTNDVGFASSTKPNILVQQVKVSTLRLAASGGEFGVKFNATGGGCAYNEVYLGDILDNNYGLYLETSDASGSLSGWVNENTFHGGKFGNGSNITQWHVYIKYGTGTHERPNNNRFLYPSFDQGSAAMQGFYYDAGRFNFLLWPRIESSTTISAAEILFAGTSLNCGIYGGLEARVGGTNETIQDYGRENMVFSSDGIQWTQGRSGSASQVINVRRGRANNADTPVPVIEAHDLYDSSGIPGQAFSSNLAREAVLGSYHYRGQAAGDMVTTGDNSDDDLIWWECIKTHASSTANTEPGVGSAHETYWVNTGTNYVKGSTETPAWDASHGTYTQRATNYEVSGTGEVHFGSSGVNTNVSIRTGTGSPESSVNAQISSIYLRSDGDPGHQLYIKESGDGTNTGWKRLSATWSAV